MAKKTIMMSVSLLLVMTLALAGCGNNNAGQNENTNTGNNGTNGADNTNTGDTSEEVATAEFYHDLPAMTDYINKVNPILAENSNVKFEVVPFSETTSFQTSLRVGFSTEDAADVFKWWNGFRMKELADAGHLADMTKEWEQMIADGVNPAMADPLTFDGKTYGIPGGVHYWVVFYNKKLFAEHNLSEPKTWEEFIALCETLKSKGITPIGQTTTDFWPGFVWFEELMIGKYPDLYEKLMIGEAKYTDPKVVEVMELWKSLNDKGYFAEPQDFYNEIPSSLLNGEFAMYLKGTWYAGFLEGAGMVAGEDYSAFDLPSVNAENGNNIISEVTPLLVSAKSANKETAIKAVTALTKKKAHEKWLSLYGGLPIRSDVESKDPVIKKLADNVGGGDYTLYTRFWEATPSELSEYAANEFVRFILDPTTYMQVLENIEEKAERYWAEQE